MSRDQDRARDRDVNETLRDDGKAATDGAIGGPRGACVCTHTIPKAERYPDEAQVPLPKKEVVGATGHTKSGDAIRLGLIELPGESAEASSALIEAAAARYPLVSARDPTRRFRTDRASTPTERESQPSGPLGGDERETNRTGSLGRQKLYRRLSFGVEWDRRPNGRDCERWCATPSSGVPVGFLRVWRPLQVLVARRGRPDDRSNPSIRLG